MPSRAQTFATVKKEVAAYVDGLQALPPDERLKVSREVLDKSFETLSGALELQLWREKRNIPELRAMAALVLAMHGGWDVFKATVDATSRAADGSPSSAGDETD